MSVAKMNPRGSIAVAGGGEDGSISTYLMKRARSSGRNWKKRWFVIEPRDGNISFSYWKDEKAFTKHGKPLGSVILSGPMAQINRMAARENTLEIFADTLHCDVQATQHACQRLHGDCLNLR